VVFEQFIGHSMWLWQFTTLCLVCEETQEILSSFH